MTDQNTMTAPEETGAEARRAEIDGVSIPIEENETILQAARRAGIFIPTLCEFAALNHTPGTCRVCLVAVEREAGGHDVVTSCDTRILPGMKIETRTAEVRRRRRLQMELLFGDHDEKCSSCARHGDCELQRAALNVGVEGTSLSGRWLAKRPVDATAPAMRFDGGKCIRCLRCIEVCRRVQGPEVAALTLESVGTGSRVGFRGAKNWGASDVCIQCGQCSLVCPTGAISVRDDCCTALDLLDDPQLVTVWQIAPAVRVAIAEEFGLPPGTNVEGRVVAALKRLGADYVMDTRWSADVTIMEEGTEMLANLERAKAEGTMERPFTYFTSCCPGWVNYVEKVAPDMIPHLSSTRSPQAIFSAVAKTWLPKVLGIDAKSIRVLSVMPCTAKKDEAARRLLAREGGARDTDLVLTVREFARLLKRFGLDLRTLPDVPFDTPLMTEASGAGQIFASSGGVMEAALRTMSALKNPGEAPRIEFEAVRGPKGVKEAVVHLGDLGDVKVAVVHECANVAHVIDLVRRGESPWHFVEVMACPNGCIGGGGTSRGRDVWGTNLAARRQTVYAIDRKMPVRAAHENPEVVRLYADFLGSPGSHLAHELLHCTYEARERHREKNTARKILHLVNLSPEGRQGLTS